MNMIFMNIMPVATKTKSETKGVCYSGVVSRGIKKIVTNPCAMVKLKVKLKLKASHVMKYGLPYMPTLPIYPVVYRILKSSTAYRF
jgi:hypothetical protein